MKNITILPADTYIVVNKTILNEEDKITTKALRIIINTPENTNSKVKLILHDYGLSKLPEILRELNSILKLY